MTHSYDSLYFFCLFIFIGHYWLKSIFIGETNICVYLKITSSASPFNNPIYESFSMTHIIFIACSRSSTLLCAYAECLKSRIFASFITPVTLLLCCWRGGWVAALLRVGKCTTCCITSREINEVTGSHYVILY